MQVCMLSELLGVSKMKALSRIYTYCLSLYLRTMSSRLNPLSVKVKYIYMVIRVQNFECRKKKRLDTGQQTSHQHI